MGLSLEKIFYQVKVFSLHQLRMLFLCVCVCVVWGYPPSQASILHPSPPLLTNSLCQALPRAALCNYSAMPQTGEMGVCYMLHVGLRKTTVGPLFVNQTQGQNKTLSGLAVFTDDNSGCIKERFYWFIFLFTFFNLALSSIYFQICH